MKNSKKRGFTIVELVIVIAVIAILAGVLIPTFVSVINKANESNDIQAARNMNTFLATAKISDDVNSIFDVYDLFDESGYSVESYKPLYKDRYYYYDKEYNQILYVDADNTVLFPTEHQGEKYSALAAKGHNWMSLGMTPVKAESPVGDNYKNDRDTKTITATVSNAAQFAYVVENYNKASDTKLNLTIDGTIDMMGAEAFIDKSQGDIKITGKNGAVIKNLTSNTAITRSNGNASGKDALYTTAALIAELNHNLTIEHVTFENINVKNIYAGGVAALIGKSDGDHMGFEDNHNTVVFNDVTLKDSTVIGHRDVGAIFGQCGKTHVKINGNVTLDNVAVKTVGGRAALFAKMYNTSTMTVASGAELINNNNSSTLSIYESKVSEQKFADGAPETCPTGWNESAWSNKTTIEGQTSYIYSVKNPDNKGTVVYSVYGFRTDAVLIMEVEGKGSTWKAYTKLEDFGK